MARRILSAENVLILPKDWAKVLEMPERSKLTWATDHPASHYGLGVMLDVKGEVFDGATFRALRDACGARIETDQPEKVCGALGLPVGERGIQRPKKGVNDDAPR